MDRTTCSLFATAIASLLFVGCAAIPQQQLDAGIVLKNKTVAVVPIGAPRDAVVNVLAPTANSFGLVGGLIEGGVMAKHTSDLAAILVAQKFDFHAELADSVMQTAQSSAANVVAPDSTGVVRSKWISPLPAAQGADVYLDVYMSAFGYIAATDNAPYVPSLDFWARVTDASGKQLYLTHIIYNHGLVNLAKYQGPKIEADAAYQFKSMDDIKANPEKAVAGLKAAMSAVTHEFSNELQQTPGLAKIN